MAQGDSLFPSRGRGLASSHGPARRLRTHRLHVRVLRRAAPTHVDLPLSAPRRLLDPQDLSPLRRSPSGPEWTFHLGLVRPREASSAPSLSPCSIVPRGPHPNAGFLDQTKCPTDGPMPVALEAVSSDNSQATETSVSSQLSGNIICIIKNIKINGNEDGSPVVLTRKMDLSLNATAEYECPFAISVVHRWEIFSVSMMYDVPDWSKPLDVPELQVQPNGTVMHLPKGSLSRGDYTVSFSVTLTTAKPLVHVVSDFDYIYINIISSPLKAVISGGANIAINFTEELVLDGSKSSDPDADSPLDGLHFRWYCTTNRNNYRGRKEMPFDWVGQTATGRNSDYLSIKAFAFREFLEAEFWIALDLDTWSGSILILKYPFVINRAPEIGECKINPPNGTAFYTKFVVRCSDFKDKNIPLTYKMIVSDLHGFAKISSLKENTLGSILYMGHAVNSPPSFLPAGVLANSYGIKIYVQVYDSLGAFSQVTLYATVRAPTDKSSSKTVLHQLLNFTMGPNSAISPLLQKQDFLSAGYLTYVVASVLNSMKTISTLQADKARLREYLVNQTFIFPMGNLMEISQVVMAVATLTQKPSEFTHMAQKLTTVRIWEANQALQQHQQKNRHFDTEQIETVCTGILTSLSNILKMIAHHQVVKDPFHVLESLADTILAGKVPGNETTIMWTTSFNVYVKKTEKENVTGILGNEKHCQNCFRPALNVSSVPSLLANSPISMMFCEFAEDPFPWLSYQENISAHVVGFRMTATAPNGSGVEITPDVAEVYLGRKNLSFAAFSLIMGPDNEPSEVDESLRKTAGGFSFEVDSGAGKEVLVHILTEVTVPFTVLVYAGSHVTPTALVATFLVPHDIPPIANQSDLFDPACTVKVARVVCLPPSLLKAIAQRSQSSECAIAVVLKAPRFVTKLSDKLVRISLFYVHCLDMFGIQSDWREDICVLGEMTTWDRVHCVCKNTRRARRQLNTIGQANIPLHARYLTAKVIVVPNPIDLRLEVTKEIAYNLVTVITVLFIMLAYILLAFWALHRDESDQFLRDYAIVLPDNDPYDHVCYLVTIFTGSRCGSGTRANVFVQLRGTESTSDVHCLSHPHFTTLYRGSISTFLLTTKSDLGDIHSIRVWHDNEGRAPSWYLSRIKVENLFSRHIWLFMCRKWLSIDTSLDRTFQVTHPDEPLRRIDFFLINATDTLGKNHIWFSVFADVVNRPFNRLQRLSCCLAMLLSSLLCNIMFFNLNTQGTEAEGSRYIRSMVIGLESVLITIPLQVIITFLFTYSQSRDRATLEEVTPREHPLMLVESEYWEERLEKWHAHETAEALAREAGKLPPKESPGLHRSLSKATSKGGQQLKKTESKVSDLNENANANANNQTPKDDEGVESAEPSSQSGPPPLPTKPNIVLPRWCVYVAWFLVFATSSISSFLIVFYGLTYSYEMAIEWLFASFCSFFLSVFLVQPSKIILLSAIRLHKLKYCKNLPWVNHYRYTEITLENMRLNPDEMRKQHDYIVSLRGTRMYQPLTEDEIRIFKRKKRLKRRALLLLIFVLTHFIFLALLLWLVALLRHTDTFYYNQFLRNRFSVDLATVTRLQDIYSWLNDVLVPLLHNSLNPTFLPESASIILGLPLMRQVRAKSGAKACLPAKNFAQTSIKGEIHCHPQYGADPEDTQNYTSSWIKISKRATDKNTKGFTYKPKEKRWPYHSHGLLHTYGSGGYAFYFFPDQEQSNSTERLKGLRSSKWLDEKTWAVILELTTLNPDANLFCSLSVVFEVSPLGVVNTSLSVHSFALADFNRKTMAEIFLYAAILIFFLAYVAHEGYVITQERASYVKSVYNLLNFALICVFAVLIVLLLRKHVLAAGLIQLHSSNSAEFIPFHAVSQVDHAMRVTLGFLLFLTILKTLRYSRIFYDVRLAQGAIQTALPGIFHMALLMSIYFFVYMAFGCLVFGQHEWNYSNLMRATQTIFSYCVSAFQNTEFSENRVLGILFLSSFVLLMICILINLLRAVILLAYKEMKQPVYEEPSEEVEAMAYLCGKLRTLFGSVSFRSKAKEEPKLFVDMLYGQPEKNSRRYLGLKTRNINERKMVYLVV
ncbi:polycystic kidney disease and receptor for egg jelly-related protein-like [Pteropus medius]|uniref:polycystic kidney disease and receptor for egg jelly-related protein-like n=1 Tax=Pteropus vampyrus TaxID=132908 RepID=UPI00196A8D7F|nr:polycystic kidney disease and receptor for egg jelly-related protein-like [Pteropus giganteus]